MRKEHARLYTSKAWKQLRKQVLIRDMYKCQMCGCMLKEGRSNKELTLFRPAVIDHIIPHRGNEDLFDCIGNVWAICCDCHDFECNRIERQNTDLLEIRRHKLDYRAIGIDGYKTTGKHRPVTDEESFKNIHSLIR